MVKRCESRSDDHNVSFKGTLEEAVFIHWWDPSKSLAWRMLNIQKFSANVDLPILSWLLYVKLPICLTSVQIGSHVCFFYVLIPFLSYLSVSHLLTVNSLHSALDHLSCIDGVSLFHRTFCSGEGLSNKGDARGKRVSQAPPQAHSATHSTLI